MTDEPRQSPTAAEIETQIRWEMEIVEAEVRRYREAEGAKNFADTIPGRKAFNRMMTPLVAAIGVRTTRKQFDLRLLPNRGPSHAAFALRLNKFAVKMPRCMAQYR